MEIPRDREPRRSSGEALYVEREDGDAVTASVEDPERFEAVFDRYHSSIWSFLARLGGPERADELAGDVFLQAFRVRARYDPTLGTVRSWLYGIASNIMHTRKRSDARGMRARARLGTQPSLWSTPSTTSRTPSPTGGTWRWSPGH
jgi:DNA-directed RNA polymerase specialized sigma24 family protein